MRFTAMLLCLVLGASSAGAAVVVAPKSRWPAGEVPFAFAPNFTGRASVLGAIDIWHDRLGVAVFRPKRDDDPVWVVFEGEPNLDLPPCRVDFAGRSPNHLSTVHLRTPADSARRFCSITDIVHELGHVLGLEHEHQRCDARQYTTLAPEAEKEIARDPLDGWIQGQYETFPCIDLEHENIGPYDFLSLVHYDPFETTTCFRSPCLPIALTEEGKRLLLPLGINTLEELARYRRDNDCENFDGSCISDGDVRAIKQMYSLP